MHFNSPAGFILKQSDGSDRRARYSSPHVDVVYSDNGRWIHYLQSVQSVKAVSQRKDINVSPFLPLALSRRSDMDARVAVSFSPDLAAGLKRRTETSISLLLRATLDACFSRVGRARMRAAEVQTF